MKPGGAAEEKSSGGMEKSGAMNKNAADDKAGAAKGKHAQGAQDKSAQDKSMRTEQHAPRRTRRAGQVEEHDGQVPDGQVQEHGD